MGGFMREAAKLGIGKMVEAACQGAAERMNAGTKLSEKEKKGVEGLMCESMTYVYDLVSSGETSATKVGIHLITNGVNFGKLTKSQQIYCSALKVELAVQSAKLAMIASATYAGAVAGANGGIVAGGITGTMIAGPAGTVPGVITGGLVGGGGPLLLGSIEMYSQVATITDLAIDLNSQCGPLTLDNLSVQRSSIP
jgi:hypothetical protein